jgi:serine/threonine protein kinase
MAHQLKLALVSKELIVSLLDYSRGPDGRPGKENGDFYVVMELGDISLEEYIDYRLKANLPLTLPEIRSILHDVTRMVCLLHSQGLAHLDVKPANIMLFNSTFWKLIDFDGCFRAASLIDVTQTDIAFTPLYCAPEIGAVIVKMSDQLKISRLMDVWSVGAIGAELASMKPIFEQVYDRMYDSVNNDDASFLKWLAADGLSSEDFREHTTPVDPELHSLLFNHMLVCDPRRRWSLPQVLKHPFFATVTNNKQTWTFPRQAPKVHENAKVPRILTLHPSEMSIDLSNPLESDDAMLLHDSSVDQDEHPGLSPLEITPMVSPQAMGNQKRFLRIFCCNSEQRTS